MVAQEYTVRLDAFEGPLDLLLYLIRRAEVDISEISIASIADQFLQHLGEIDRIDVEVAGEFLVIAATIVEMKSRLVQAGATDRGDPGAALLDADDGEEHGAATLVRQLLEYKAYRDAADALEARRDDWQLRVPAAVAGWERADPDPGEADALDLEDVSVLDLVEAFGRIIETVQFDRLGDHRVVFDDTPIELYQADLVDVLQRRGASGEPSGLRDVLAGRTRVEMIGVFLALLELARQRRIAIDRDADGGFLLRLREPDSERDADAAASWDGDHIIDDDEVEDDGDDDRA